MAAAAAAAAEAAAGAAGVGVGGGGGVGVGAAGAVQEQRGADGVARCAFESATRLDSLDVHSMQACLHCGSISTHCGYTNHGYTHCGYTYCGTLTYHG